MLRGAGLLLLCALCGRKSRGQGLAVQGRPLHFCCSRPLAAPLPVLLQGAVAACAAPLVGQLAQRIFGFSGSGTGEGWG